MQFPPIADEQPHFNQRTINQNALFRVCFEMAQNEFIKVN